MNVGRIVGTVVGAASLVGLAALLAWLYAPSAGPPLDLPREEVTRPGARPSHEEAGADDGADGVSAGRPRGSASVVRVDGAEPATPALDGGGADGAASSVASRKAPRRAFGSPEEAETFVAGRVTELFAAVAPEIDPADIERECSDDGRRCTFRGPWPGDDLFARWTRAIADGRTGLAEMQGVTFSSFKKVDDGGEPGFVIEANAP